MPFETNYVHLSSRTMVQITGFMISRNKRVIKLVGQIHQMQVLKNFGNIILFLSQFSNYCRLLQ